MALVRSLACCLAIWLLLATQGTGARVDLIADTAAAPIPVCPAGPAPAGSYSTSLIGGDFFDTEYGLRAITSTAPGTFALSVLVVTDGTSAPISGATVALESGAGTLTTTTDERGAFAFMDVPAGGGWNLTVSAHGYGAYRWLNDTYEAGETYDDSIFLDESDQIYDDTPTTPG